MRPRPTLGAVSELYRRDGRVVRVPAAPVALSTASVYPRDTRTAFELASKLGYDGIELMVWTDPVSQDPDAVGELAEEFNVPILAIHAPCLLITQRVWSSDPWERLARSVEAARRLGSDTVVVHPPFRWQRDYARYFAEGVAALEEESGIAVAVENMYPWRAANRELMAYAPGWDPTDGPYANLTLDVSHAAVAGMDSVDLAREYGSRLSHLHLTDGTDSARDEHLVPGRGKQPCAGLLEYLAGHGYARAIVLEVTTRRARDESEREADLAEALAFTRLHFAAPVTPSFAVDAAGVAAQIDQGSNSRV